MTSLAPFNNFDEAQPTLQHLHHNQQPQQLQGQPQHHVQQQGVSKTIPLQNRYLDFSLISSYSS